MDEQEKFFIFARIALAIAFVLMIAIAVVNIINISCAYLLTIIFVSIITVLFLLVSLYSVFLAFFSEEDNK